MKGKKVFLFLVFLVELPLRVIKSASELFMLRVEIFHSFCKYLLPSAPSNTLKLLNFDKNYDHCFTYNAHFLVNKMRETNTDLNCNMSTYL